MGNRNSQNNENSEKIYNIQDRRNIMDEHIQSSIFNDKKNNKFIFSNILCKVIWIHYNKFKNLNEEFQSLLSKRNLEFKEAFDVKSGIEEIKSIKFKCVYVIISGSMFTEFIKLFKENLNQIFCIPIITMFTMQRKHCLEYEYANHPFYNPGGVHVQYDEIIQTFIKFDSLVKKKIEKNIISPVYNNECFSFEKIDSIPKLYFPFIYSKLIEKIEDEEINEFNENILKYDNKKITELIYPLIFLKQIPVEILVKFWLRIYTLETDFYSNMNCKLMKLKGKEFETFIKLMYFSLNNKLVTNRCDIYLFRGDILNNGELENIINKGKSDSIKDKLIYCRKFLSFSSSKEIAEQFIKSKYIQKGNSINYVLFQIEPFKGNIEDAKCYNIDMRPYSQYQNEEEYLFLPYSPFIINYTKNYNISINGDSNITINLINLSYIGTYQNIIKESMKNISSLDDLSFGLLEKYFLDEIKIYKIFEKENFWDKIKILIKQNDI